MKAFLAAWKFSFTIPALFIFTNTKIVFDYECEYDILDSMFLFLGLMSVTAQHLDYLKTALKTLEVSSENQYKIRGQPRFDKVSWEVKRSYCLIVQCYQQLRALNINYKVYIFNDLFISQLTKLILTLV